MDRLSVLILTCRKFSFSANLHSTELLGFPEIGGAGGTSGIASISISSMARSARLSNVSDVVSRKRLQDIIRQGKCLCGQDIRCRLKWSGMLNRKLGLQRIRSIVRTPSIYAVRDVFLALLSIINKAARIYY